ncbi:MAG: cysteine rich repeat-containing protein [Xanthobacteraceae bacterium]
MRKIRGCHLIFATAAALGLVATSPGEAFAQAQVSPEVKALVQVCRADFNQLCPGVQPGGGRVLACLKSQSSKLSPPCRDAMSKASKAGTLPQ